MNRKQWFVLGLGLILMSLFFSISSGILAPDCLDLQQQSIDLMEEALDSGIKNVQDFNNDKWVISCLESQKNISIISSIIFGLGILFVICGFLEPKKKEV